MWGTGLKQENIGSMEITVGYNSGTTSFLDCAAQHQHQRHNRTSQINAGKLVSEFAIV